MTREYEDPITEEPPCRVPSSAEAEIGNMAAAMTAVHKDIVRKDSFTMDGLITFIVKVWFSFRVF